MSVDRDRILEQALKHELRGNATPASTCLDAETLAAWQDESVDAAQMEAIEQHVSTCARCQAMVAAFARGTVAAEPGTPALGTVDVPGTAGTLGTPGTVSWWRWWLAPIAAGAVAVTMWMVVPEQQEVATRPPVPQSSTVAVDKAQPPAVLAEKSAAAEPPPAAASPSPADSIQARARADNEAQENKVKRESARDERQQFKDQAAAEPKEEVALTQAAPAAPAAPAARADAGARIGALQKGAQAAFARSEIVAPDLSTRWRAAARGIERSTDAGATWTLVHEARNVTITAGVALTPSVCWLASESGVVYVAADGQTFARTFLPPPPPDYGWSMRVVSIVATDARVATVVTADGTRFRTEDGGLTWRLIPA